MQDLLERLTELKVPPAPKSLKRDVHHRVNRALLVKHVVELAIYGAIYAGGHLLRGLMGLAVYTFTGEFPVDRDDRPKPRKDA